MSVPSFSTATQWHTLRLDDVTIPGVAALEIELDDPRDHQKPSGGNKGRTKNKGAKGAKFKVTVRLADAKEAEEFSSVAVPILRKRSNAASPDPHKISHPMAAFWGISVVTVGKISSPSPSSKEGMTVSFELGEWVPEPKEAKAPKEAPKQPSAAEPGHPPPTLAEIAAANAGLTPPPT